MEDVSLLTEEEEKKTVAQVHQDPTPAPVAADPEPQPQEPQPQELELELELEQEQELALEQELEPQPQELEPQSQELEPQELEQEPQELEQQPQPQPQEPLLVLVVDHDIIGEPLANHVSVISPSYHELLINALGHGVGNDTAHAVALMMILLLVSAYFLPVYMSEELCARYMAKALANCAVNDIESNIARLSLNITTRTPEMIFAQLLMDAVTMVAFFWDKMSAEMRQETHATFNTVEGGLFHFYIGYLFG